MREFTSEEVVAEAEDVLEFGEKSRGLRWERLRVGGRTKRGLEAIPKWRIVPFALANV